MTNELSERIPVILLTGFLGSGKTTVLNHLVHQPELADTMVIINEFGEMALDHMLVAHSTENLMMEMSSGCLCCSIRGDLVKTLNDITWRFSRNGERWFKRVLIETTGLADPAPIVHTLLTHPKIAPKYQLEGIVTTVDLVSGSSTLDAHAEAIKQAAVADALLLTKADLVTDAERKAMEDRLDGINPAAPKWEVKNGVIAPERVMGLGLFSVEGKAPDVERWLGEEAYEEISPHGHAHHHHSHDHDHGDDSGLEAGADENGHGHGHHHHDVNRHDDRIQAFCFSVDEPIDDDKLGAWLGLVMGLVGSNILRIKAILNIEGSEQPIVVHGVQHTLHPPVALPEWPSEDHRSRFVFITQDVGRDVIEKTFRPFQQRLQRATEAAS
ncbi:MAG: GTP-binding protein [Pseudomonadota bacterium]